MVKVRSFKGFLANQENAVKIISPPYDVLNTEEARAMADGNPIERSQTYRTEIISEVGCLGFLVTPVESGYVLRSSFAIAWDG